MKSEKKVSFQEIENSDEEQGLTQFEIDDSNVKRKSRCNCYFSGVEYLLVIIIVIITGGLIYLFSQYYEYDGISARLMMGHHHHHKKTCEDFEFGCCEIYDKCIDKISYLQSNNIELSFHRIIARDTLKTNCPTLESLVNDYNYHYYPNIHDCGEFGCCNSIEVGCDNSIRTSFHNENNKDTINYYNNHKKCVQIMKQKIDQVGSNCDRYDKIYDVIYSYNYNYPENENLKLLIIICLILVVLFCCPSHPASRRI
jgi:hypothetical protein